MALAQDIVQALIERAPPRVPVERRTGMPYGWALWLGLAPLLIAVQATCCTAIAAWLVTRPEA